MLELLEPGQARLDRARRLPAARRRRPLRLRRRGLLDGHRDARALPAGHLRHPRGHRAHRGRARAWATRSVGRGRRRRRAGGSSRRRSSRAAAGSARALAIGGRVVLERGVTVGENTTIERAVVMRGRRRSAPTARCAAASSAAGVPIGDDCHVDGLSVLGEGVDARRRQRRLQRRADLPGRDAARRGAAVLMAPARSREAVAARRLDRPGGRDPRPRRRTCATRCGAWTPPAVAPVDAPGGLIVAGMGGSAVGGAARARRRSAPRLTRPFAVADGYALPAWAGPRAARAVLELLRQHRGDPRPPTTTRSSAARRGSSPPPAARWPSAPARDGVPVIPLPGGFQPRAAVGYGLVVRAGGGARWPAPRRRCATRSRRRPRWPRRSPPSGGRTATRTARRRRSRGALHGTVPVIAGAELAAPVAYRWKCQVNENAGLPAFASDAARGRPQRGRRLARRGRPRPVLRRLPRGPRRAPAQRAAHRAHRRPRRRRAPTSSSGSSARGETRARAAGLARAARRPRVALPRGARGHRSGRHRPDRPPQGRSSPLIHRSGVRPRGAATCRMAGD